MISADIYGIQLISNPTWYQLITLGLSWYHPARMYVYTRMQIPYAYFWVISVNSFDPRSKKSVDEKINIGNVKMNAGIPSYPILFYLAGRIPSPPTPPPFKKKSHFYQKLAFKNHLKRLPIRKQPRNTRWLNNGNPNFYLGSCYFSFVSDRQWYDQLSWDCSRKPVTPGFFQTCWFNTIKLPRN